MLENMSTCVLGPGEVGLEECGRKMGGNEMDEASRDLQVFLFTKAYQPDACICVHVPSQMTNNIIIGAGEGTWMQFLVVVETCQWSCGTQHTNSRTLVVYDPLFP